MKLGNNSKYSKKGDGYQTFYGSADVFSNWFPANFIMQIDGQTYNFCSSEQALMLFKAKTFGDIEIMPKIMSVSNQALIKAYGRKVKGFDQNIWTTVREDIMVSILVEKFKQNPELKQILLDTHDDVIIEASPTDKIWGVGKGPETITADKKTWNGLNLLGYSLMKTRDLLK